MTEATTVETNGAAPADAGKPTKEPTILTAIKEKWTAGGKKLAPKSVTDPLWKKWSATRSEIEKAEAAIEKLREAEYAVTAQLAEAYGAQSVNVGGKVYDFASRKEKIFLRAKNVTRQIIEV